MARVLVIGARGHLGQQAVAGLRRLGGGAEVICGSRRGDAAVDLARPQTWEALRAFDLIVNCADTVTAPPDGLIRFCLEEGLALIETGSEPGMVRRVLASARPSGASPQGQGGWRGVVVVGAGIFTGLSNLLGAAAVERAGPGCQRLALGIQWSPLSAGGGGMVNLVGHLLGASTVRYEGGVAVEGPPVQAGVALAFGAQRAPRATLHLPFSEASMLRLSTGLPAVAVYGALQPALLGAMFLWLPLWLLQTRAMRGWLWLQFTLLRRVLLRWRRSPVDLVAVASDAQGRRLAVGHLHADDGMALAGGAIAAQAEALLAGRPAPGLYMADECARLDPIFSRAQALCVGSGSSQHMDTFSY
jgi:hypothetical protein